jgi:hypothetical protein
MTRSKALTRIVVVVAVAVGFGVLFVRSVRHTHAQPYTVERAHLLEWRLEIVEAPAPAGALVVLRPRPELVMGLFRQVFTRAMESLNTPAAPAVPLLLHAEFERAFAGHVSPEALLEAARGAGLETTMREPRCLAHRRVSEPGATRQLYFLLFDAPAFHRVREEMAAMVDGTRAREFEPTALSPVLFIGASGPPFEWWLPLRADPETDCVAPVEVS